MRGYKVRRRYRKEPPCNQSAMLIIGGERSNAKKNKPIKDSYITRIKIQKLNCLLLFVENFRNPGYLHNNYATPFPKGADLFSLFLRVHNNNNKYISYVNAEILDSMIGCDPRAPSPPNPSPPKKKKKKAGVSEQKTVVWIRSRHVRAYRLSYYSTDNT